MTLNRGAELYSPGGRLLEAGSQLQQPGLVAALETVAAEGADSVYRGSIAGALLDVPGVVISRADLERYEARWANPAEVPYAETRFLTRGGLSGVPELVVRLPRLAGLEGDDCLFPVGQGGVEALPPPPLSDHRVGRGHLLVRSCRRCRCGHGGRRRAGRRRHLQRDRR